MGVPGDDGLGEMAVMRAAFAFAFALAAAADDEETEPLRVPFDDECGTEADVWPVVYRSTFGIGQVGRGGGSVLTCLDVRGRDRNGQKES